MKVIIELYKIEYTDDVKRQLNSIYYYIENHLLNPIAAKNFYIQFIQKIQILKSFPYALCFYKDTRYRYLPYKKWLIIYEIKDNYIIEIQTIFNSKQNLSF